MIDREVTLFPEPDSPTRPKTSPLPIEKLMSSTTLVSPSSVANQVDSPLTTSTSSITAVSFLMMMWSAFACVSADRSCAPSGNAHDLASGESGDGPSLPAARVEVIAQSITEEVETEYAQNSEDAGEDDDPP